MTFLFESRGNRNASSVLIEQGIATMRITPRGGTWHSIFQAFTGNPDAWLLP